MSPSYWLPAILAGATLATSATAAPLTFAQALAKADATAPSLRAAGLQMDAARAAARPAGSLPDPQLRFGIDNFPISGPSAGRFGADEMTMARVGVMQELPSRAKRNAELGLGQADIGAAQAQAAVERQTIRLAAALAWTDLYYAEQRLAALDAVLQTLEPLWASAPAAVASGSSRPAAALAPIRLRAALQDQRSELAAAAGRARAALSRWTDDPSPTVAGVPPELGLDEATLREDLDRHPSLLAYGAAHDRAQASLALAQAAKRPDWSAEVSYGRRDPMFGDMVSAGVGVRLPLFTRNRQDPTILARRLEVSRVALDREGARRALLAALTADLADHVMHHEQWLRARDLMLPAARQQADLETASYGAGRASLADVLEAFTDLTNARLVALEREAAVAQDLIRINFTYGSATS